MMRSIKQDQLKYDLHNELQMRYREFFESQLAIHLLNHTEYFLSAKKVSAAILKLILANRNTVITTIKTNLKIIMELREPYFGSCFDSKQEVVAEDAYKKIILILANSSDLKEIMQIHCIFIHRIYDQIEKNNEKAELANTILLSSLFSKNNRSRTEKKEEVKNTTQLGITNHPVFSKMLKRSDKKHMRALDKYKPDHNVIFFKSAAEKAIPVVCGPSGHTASLMLGAKLYGELTTDELSEYTLACFAFLTAGGNHSFYEVFIVANLLGVSFQLDNYSKNIPALIIETDAYKNLSKRFPEFLTSNISHEKNENTYKM